MVFTKAFKWTINERYPSLKSLIYLGDRYFKNQMHKYRAYLEIILKTLGDGVNCLVVSIVLRTSN